MRISFLILFVFLSSYTYCQRAGYEPGYIIQHNGDTIQGFVKDRSPEPFVDLYDRIRFIQSGKKRRKKYDADDIKGYGYRNMQFLVVPFLEEQRNFRMRYFSRPQDPKRFMKVINYSEAVIHYEQEFVHDDNSYVDFIPFFHVPEKREMVRVTQGILGYKKKRLTEYFNQCPELLDQLDEVNIPALYSYLLQNCTE